MSATDPAAANWMVPSLSEASRSVAEWVFLAPLQVLEGPGEPPEHVYFPAGCAIALLLPRAGGATGLAALVGHEGLVGVEAYLGAGSRVTDAITMVQTGGPAWRLPAGQMRCELANNFALRQRLMRYSLALVSQMARIAACSREHSTEQQIARWLLQSADRAPQQPVPMDAGGVAALLALEREAAATALERLARAGGIDCGVAHITLRDRTVLQAAACTCHAAIRESELRAQWPEVQDGGAQPRLHGAAAQPVES
jgi:CRP-like cAMP-binding protein